MATKERLIVKTSYMDVLERMLRKRGVKVVMSGVREMTLAEEIRNLAELGVDQNVIDRMTQKYNRMLTDHGNTCNKIRDEVYREVRGVKAELAEKETIIRVLTTHIEKKKKEEKTTLPMLRFGSNSVRITEDELVMLSNRYNEYVESTPDEGFITWLLKRGL